MAIMQASNNIQQTSKELGAGPTLVHINNVVGLRVRWHHPDKRKSTNQQKFQYLPVTEPRGRREQIGTSSKGKSRRLNRTSGHHLLPQFQKTILITFKFSDFD
jgi:hypothetical protein